MDLKLYNTATRTKEVFTPLDPKNVRLYVCGPTVYDFAHIGNARPVIVFDLLFRLLRHRYGADHVTYVRNITDVDDKIIDRALAENVAIEELTERTTQQFHDDIVALGVLPPTVEPRATKHIPQMRDMIERLIGNRHAYIAEEHALFDVSSMPDYGKLSGRSLDEMIAGARVDVAPYKKSPTDFVLWKPTDQRRSNRLLPAWKSPKGISVDGRPGWHIECSAMAAEHLGPVFDIHGGGIDLVFPHHENELAQSRCAHGTPLLAKVWMHNGFLQVEGEKMSKSLGNFVTIRELLKDWPGEVIRLNMLKTHYRQPIDWTLRGLKESEQTLRSWFSWGQDLYQGDDERFADELYEALCDDLNTPKAIAVLHGYERSGNLHDLVPSLRALGIWGHGLIVEDDLSNVDVQSIESCIGARNAARKAKDFKEADRIRDELLAQGIVLKDGPDGTTWELKR